MRCLESRACFFPMPSFALKLGAIERKCILRGRYDLLFLLYIFLGGVRNITFFFDGYRRKVCGLGGGRGCIIILLGPRERAR